MTIKKITKYDNVKLKGQDGILKLSEDCILIFKPRSSREQGGAETQWDVSALQATAVKSSADGHRHWIRLKVDGLTKPIIIRFESRQEVERLRRNLVRVRENTIKSQRRQMAENNNRRRNQTNPSTTTSSPQQPREETALPPPQQRAAPAGVPVVTATPINNHQRPPGPFRGSDIEDGIINTNDIPLVSTVILLPIEDDDGGDGGDDYYHNMMMEEEDLIEQDSNNINENILHSLRPPPVNVAQTLRSLRFWDSNNAPNKPKSGDGLKDGFPNICYISLYLLTITFLVLTIVSQIYGVGPYFLPNEPAPYMATGGLYDYGDTDDVTDDNRIILVYLFIIFYVSFLIMSLCGRCGCDNTIVYLRNSKPSTEVADMLKLAIAKKDPKISIKVRCWHKETHHYTDSKGRRRSRTENVTTFEQKFPVPVTSCVDETNFEHIDLHKYKITKVKLVEAIVPDQNFMRYRDKLHEDNKDRDVYCDVTELMDLNLPFKPCILCLAAGQNEPCTLHPAVHVICHLLIVPALPFRLWMGYVTGKMRLELKKSIQTNPPIQ